MQTKNPKITVIVGGQWGDEGKGKVIDLLAKQADIVYKPNGGSNAGHTVINPLGEFALHLTPAGIFNPDTDNVVGDGVVYNIRTGMDEIYSLESRGVSTKKLFISSRTQLTFDYHKLEDSLQEDFKGENRVGTTHTGNGPAYSDKAHRLGIRAEALHNPKLLMQKLSHVLKIKAQLYFSSRKVPDEFKPEYYESLVKEAAKVLEPKVVDTYLLTQKHLSRGSRILIEGSHGALLDINGGTYPMVTSSSCSVNGLLMGAGLPRVHVDRAIGIFKAYQTRVGSGGMPTELLNKTGELIRQKAHEFGTTTGRPRRVGWFDGVAAKHSQFMNGFTDIVITRGDILTDVGGVFICKEYKLDGKPTSDFPSNDQQLQKCKPIINSKDIFDWKEDFMGASKWADLPKQAQKYFMAITSCVPNATLSYIGTGPKRKDIIIMGKK